MRGRGGRTLEKAEKNGYSLGMLDILANYADSSQIFLQPIELSKAFLVFLFFSAIGWLCEVAYVGIFFEHRFVNRGFLTGPLCPVYGIGGILLLSLPEAFQNPVWRLFCTGVVLCSAVEYAAGYALEKIFHTKWWDYSDKKISAGGRDIPLNLHGRICLQNSLLFGVMTVAVLKFVQPLIVRLLAQFADIYIQLAASALGLAFILDILVSVRRAVNFNVYIARLKDFGETLKDRYQNEDWFRSGSLTEMLESVRQKAKQERGRFSESLLKRVEHESRHHKLAESFVRRFPTMKSAAYKDSISHLKERIRESIAEKKAARSAGQ